MPSHMQENISTCGALQELELASSSSQNSEIQDTSDDRKDALKSCRKACEEGESKIA